DGSAFSDGSTIKVGTLPDSGDGLPVTFGPKTITWVKVTVNQAVGQNIGLSEIEVYGMLANSTNNCGPQISYGPLANPSVVNTSDSSNLSVRLSTSTGTHCNTRGQRMEARSRGMGRQLLSFLRLSVRIPSSRSPLR